MIRRCPNTYRKYSTFPKIWTSPLLPVVSKKIAGWVANSVDTDQMPYSAASDLGLQCLLRPRKYADVNDGIEELLLMVENVTQHLYHIFFGEDLWMQSICDSFYAIILCGNKCLLCLCEQGLNILGVYTRKNSKTLLLRSPLGPA